MINSLFPKYFEITFGQALNLHIGVKLPLALILVIITYEDIFHHMSSRCKAMES